jgi:hypothetical protein
MMKQHKLKPLFRKDQKNSQQARSASANQARNRESLADLHTTRLQRDIFAQIVPHDRAYRPKKNVFLSFDVGDFPYLEVSPIYGNLAYNAVSIAEEISNHRYCVLSVTEHLLTLRSLTFSRGTIFVNGEPLADPHQWVSRGKALVRPSMAIPLESASRYIRNDINSAIYALYILITQAPTVNDSAIPTPRKYPLIPLADCCDCRDNPIPSEVFSYASLDTTQDALRSLASRLGESSTENLLLNLRAMAHDRARECECCFVDFDRFSADPALADLGCSIPLSALTYISSIPGVQFHGGFLSMPIGKAIPTSATEAPPTSLLHNFRRPISDIDLFGVPHSEIDWTLTNNAFGFFHYEHRHSSGVKIDMSPFLNKTMHTGRMGAALSLNPFFPLVPYFVYGHDGVSSADDYYTVGTTDEALRASYPRPQLPDDGRVLFVQRDKFTGKYLVNPASNGMAPLLYLLKKAAKKAPKLFSLLPPSIAQVPINLDFSFVLNTNPIRSTVIDACNITLFYHPDRVEFKQDIFFLDQAGKVAVRELYIAFYPKTKAMDALWFCNDENNNRTQNHSFPEFCETLSPTASKYSNAFYKAVFGLIEDV